MAEILQFPKNNERLLQSAEAISLKAVDLVAKRYGTGYIDSEIQAEESNLAYHNMQHTMHVQYDSQLMADALELNDLDTAIVRMAASAHDIVQQKGRGDMERESASWLEQEMLRAGFSQDDILAAGLAILGTEPIISPEGFIVGQKASQQDYPSARAQSIALCVACADMAGLYDSTGPIISRNVYKEFQGVATTDTPDLHGLPRFQTIQLDLLQRYRFPHPAGEELFAGLRPEVIEYQKFVTRQILDGSITEWSQLLDQDTEFCHLYS